MCLRNSALLEEFDKHRERLGAWLTNGGGEQKSMVEGRIVEQLRK